MRRPLVLLAFGAALGAIPPAPAAAGLVEDCYNATLVTDRDNNDEIIAICTRAIGSPARTWCRR